MTNANKVKVLRSHINKLKNKNMTPASIRAIIRMKALVAYYQGMSEKIVSRCYDISIQSLKRWIGKFESFGIDSIEDEKRSGRPVKLPKERQEELKKIIETQNQRVWVARHVFILLCSTFEVIYSVKYIPEFLRNLGLSFHKATHYLIKKNSEKRKKWIQEELPKIYEKKIKSLFGNSFTPLASTIGTGCLQDENMMIFNQLKHTT